MNQEEKTESQVGETAQVEESVLDQIGAKLRTQVETSESQGETQEETQEETNEETQNETQEEVQNETEATQNETQVPTIDDDIIKQYPVLRMYRGKPLTDIAKAYDNVVRKFTKNSMELAEIKKKIESNSLPSPDEAPDPVEKPEEFKKWIQDYTEKIREEERGKAKEQPPDIKEVLQSQLPNVNIDEVVQDWSNTNAYKLFDFNGELRTDIQEFYNKHPEILVQEIITFHNLVSKAKKNEQQIKQEANQKAYVNVKNAIKKADEFKDNMPQAQINPIQRTTQLTEEEELLVRIGQLIPNNEEN